MPTTRRRHSITETPRVEAALTELRAVTAERVDLAELVVLGARAKVTELRSQDADQAALRSRLADRIRRRDIPVDIDAAREVRLKGWTRA